MSPFYFPDRERPGHFSDEDTKDKFVVVLLTDPPLEPRPDTIVLIASTFRANAPEFHEVLIPPTPQGFNVVTAVDCSRPYTVPRNWIGADLRFRLREEVMHEVNVRLSVMLQLR